MLLPLLEPIRLQKRTGKSAPRVNSKIFKTLDHRMVLKLHYMFSIHMCFLSANLNFLNKCMCFSSIPLLYLILRTSGASDP